jgi:hypothetical protein
MQGPVSLPLHLGGGLVAFIQDILLVALHSGKLPFMQGPLTLLLHLGTVILMQVVLELFELFELFELTLHTG